MKRCFIDRSKQQRNQQPGDLAMTTTYESTDPSSTTDTAYTHIQKPQHDYDDAR